MQKAKEIESKSKAYDPAKVKAQYEKRLAAWKEQVKKAKAAKKKFPRKPRMPENPANARTNPTALFNGLINPIVGYGIKGAIWYQGESNKRQNFENYSDYFSLLINSWRKKWGQSDFPFYFCQLAAFMDPNKDPLAKDDWTTVCDQQRITLSKTKNTGMAVLNDIGEAKDIHPRNKVDAGIRLAQWALAKDYGKTRVHSGPLYKSHKIAGNKIVISFDHIGSGLMVGHKNLLDKAKEVDAPLKRFQICGEDKQWKWADAKIVGDTVVVSHKAIDKPTAVRYAWSPNPQGANLYNKDGFPASLFKTD